MPVLNCSSLDFNTNIRFVSNYSWWLVFLLPSLSHLLHQEVIDIFEGVRDDQALRMAANLGFKGPLERQVMGLDWISAKEILLLESVSLTEAQWPSPYLTFPPSTMSPFMSWKKARVLVMMTPPIQSLNISCLSRNHRSSTICAVTSST